MALLDLLAQQNAGYQIGRIRLGEYIPPKDGKSGRAAKLPGFRLTTASRMVAESAAEVYDGRLSKFEPQRGRVGYAVDTDLRELGVMITLSEKTIRQTYEMWPGAKCARRCDSVREEISGGPCLCPADPAERARLAKLNPPKACKPYTRFWVALADLPGMGGWRLDTTSGHAARDNLVIAQFMAEISKHVGGGWLPGRLLIDEREVTLRDDHGNAELVKINVPVLQTNDTIRALATGEATARPFRAMLPPAPPTARAITAGGGGQDDTPPPPDPGEDIAEAVVVDPQSYVEEANAAGSWQEIQRLADRAAAEGVREDVVTVEGEDGQPTQVVLADYLRRLWRVHNDRARGL